MDPDKEYDIVNFPIPEHCVGLVIGKGGSEVNSIFEKTGCRLQVHTEPSTTGFRMVEIHGPRNKIEMAKDCISQVIARVMRPSELLTYRNSYFNENSQGNNRFQSDPPKQTIVMCIPPNKCGSLIGKGGETLRKLRIFTNCNIQLIQENTAPNGMRPLKITGEQQAVDYAQQVVLDFLADGENFTSPNYTGPNNGIAPTLIMTLHVKVPRLTVGAIMGEHGRTVKELAEKTGTKIQFLPDEDPKSMERMLALVGTRHQVHLAATFIKDIVETCTNGVIEPIALYYLDVPSTKCGLVIGKGGEVIKQINAESGAHCELYRDGQPNPEVKTFVMKGTEAQVEHAKHLIFTKVGEIPPNTPYVPRQQMRHMMQQMPIPQQLMQAQIQARLQAQIQAQLHAQQQMQARSPQPNTLTNVQMWTGQPIIQNQNPNHPQTQLLQQQLQQRQAQQLQQEQLQQQQFQMLQQQHLQQQRLQQQQAMMQSGQFNQQGPYPQSNLPAWQKLVLQQPNQSGQSRPQQFSPGQNMQNQYQSPYQQGSPQQPYPILSPSSLPVQRHPPFVHPFLQAKKPMDEGDRNISESPEKQNNDEGVPDYSEQWYQYYLSINDHENAENVRLRIEEMKAEKALKTSTSGPSSSHSRR